MANKKRKRYDGKTETQQDDGSWVLDTVMDAISYSSYDSSPSYDSGSSDSGSSDSGSCDCGSSD